MVFLRYILVFLGGVFIGLGAGTILGNNLFVTNTNYWAFSAGSLVLGGFLMALGVMSGRRREKKPKEEKKEPQADADLPKDPGNSETGM